MKKIIATMLLSLTMKCLGSMAQTTLVVLQTSGIRTTFLLSDKPEIRMSGDDCVFIDQSRHITIARANISDFHFENGSASVGNVASDDIHTEFISEDVLRVMGVKPDAISVYDVQGKVVKVDVETDMNGVIISFSNLPAGIYIIRYAGCSVKVMKR